MDIAATAAPPTLPIVYAAQFAQQSALKEDGYSVRNTFIDSPVVWWESCSAAPRSHSSPPVAGRLPDRRFPAPGDDDNDLHDDPGSSSGTTDESCATAPAGAQRSSSRNCRNSDSRSPDRAVPRRKQSGSRTTADVTANAADSCSSGSRCSSVNLPSDSTPSRNDGLSTACSDSGEAGSSGDREHGGRIAAELGQEDWIALKSISDTVERQCAFLRLNGHTLHVENALRMRSRGVVATLRFYAYGLPWPKRAKWVQPLCRSVAAILRHNGCEAKLLGGELQVMLRGESVVRVDFSAARL